jgi:transketolase C-terminal domain/subunit
MMLAPIMPRPGEPEKIATEPVAVVDEHTVMSGLAPALALEMAKSGHTRPLLVRGIEDCITKIIGSRDYLLRHHGLDRHSLVLAFDKFLQS